MRKDCIVTIVLILLFSTGLSADETPEFWSISGLDDKEVIFMYANPFSPGFLESKLVGSIPGSAKNLPNLGCVEKEDASDNKAKFGSQSRRTCFSERQCKTRYDGVVGWVSEKYLKPQGPGETRTLIRFIKQETCRPMSSAVFGGANYAKSPHWNSIGVFKAMEMLESSCIRCSRCYETNFQNKFKKQEIKLLKDILQEKSYTNNNEEVDSVVEKFDNISKYCYSDFIVYSRNIILKSLKKLK